MKVALLATGRAEIEGLPGALMRLFDRHTFHPIFERALDRKPFDGFTSTPPPEAAAIPGVLKVVQRAAAELESGAADRVVILDDLELVNMSWPARVVESVRLAVSRHLEDLARRGQGPVEPLAQALRERASFHLAVPMLEAWFFGDPEVLGAMALNSWPALRPGLDPEAFQTADLEYASDDGSACKPWQHLTGKRRKLHRPEWDRPDRCSHPKAYLAWLMKDPAVKRCSRYRETDHGVRALERLEWRRVLSQSEHYAYLRALIEDLSITLDEPLEWLADPPVSVPTRYRHGGATVLRNL